jgi:prephenate dehydrogenase
MCDVVILATPVNTILQLIKVLPSFHPGSPIILDVGSTKTRIVRAMSGLPARFDPIAGHPMCGKEKLSLANADPLIFKAAPFVFVRLPNTSQNAVRFAEGLCRIINAIPLWLDAEEQDRWTAATSHLPYLVAAAMVQSTPEESYPLIGPGFRTTTRLASTPPSMMMDILATNRTNILERMDHFSQCFSELKHLLEDENYSRLGELLTTNSTKRGILLEGFQAKIE